MKTISLSILSLISLTSLAQRTIVSQDFSSSNNIDAYVSTAPNSGQFNLLSVESSSLLPDPDNSNRLAGALGSSSIQIEDSKVKIDLKSAWCIYRTNESYFSLNTLGSYGTIRRATEGVSAFTLEFKFSKFRSLGENTTRSNGTLSFYPFTIDLGSSEKLFSAYENTYSGEQTFFMVSNNTATPVEYNYMGSKMAQAKTAHLYIGETLVQSKELESTYTPIWVELSVRSDDYFFTREPYYAAGNPTMSTYTTTFDNFNLKDISPYTNSSTPADYAYTAGYLTISGTENQRNVYTREVDSPTLPGEKETVKIYFDGTQWVWELAPSISSGRTIAAILSTNTSQSAPNAPCSGWTNGFELGGGGCNNTPLPVTLTQFMARTSENNTSLLQWATSSETNSDYFEIEQSTNSKNWKKIAEVAAKGESGELHNYNYTHTTPNAGNNYYRLKQVDKDRSFAYSRIVSLQHNHIDNLSLLYPNPVSDRLYIKDNGKAVNVELLDLSGKAVLVTSHNLDEGIPLHNVNNGIYLVKVLDANGRSVTQKVVVQK